MRAAKIGLLLWNQIGLLCGTSTQQQHQHGRQVIKVRLMLFQNQIRTRSDVQ